MFNFKKQLGNAIQRTVQGKMQNPAKYSLVMFLSDLPVLMYLTSILQHWSQDTVLMEFWVVVTSSIQVHQNKSGSLYLAIRSKLKKANH